MKPLRPPRPLALLLSLLLVSAAAGCSGSTGGGAGAASGDGGGSSAPPASDDPVAAALLAAHNAARAAASPTPSPALAALTWSDAAASAAQAWADGCQWKHDPDLDTLGMGQNIYAAGSTSATFDTSPAAVVASWVSEAASYDYATNSCAAGKVCGHYTAVVWRSTTGVGCGHRVCGTGSPWGSSYPYWDYWVCDYVPPGNWVGEQPY